MNNQFSLKEDLN